MNKKNRSSPKMLRLLKADRWIHWSIALPCIVCYLTALILVIIYNPEPSRPFRDIFSWIHRISGVSLVVLPMLAMYYSKHDLRSYVHNINQAWAWTFKDLKCFCLLVLSSISRRALIPKSDRLGTSVVKFNYAAAMILMSSYPFFIITGIFIWITNGTLLFWLIHFVFALMATLLLLGHILMSILNPPTRVALSKKISGFVDRRYMKHDHTR
jgi:cytochrome b subunit of formate dehydrogenase